MKDSLGRVSGQKVSAVAQFPFLTIVQTYFLQPASGSKVQGERWAPGSNFARVSPGTTASLPANLLLHCLHLACSSCLLVTSLHGAFWLLDPCFLSCIFACFVPAICWCRHRRPILPLSPISTVVAIFINHLPWFPMMTIKLSHVLSL